MEYLKGRWKEMNLGRRIILLIHPVLSLLALILSLTLGQQQVASYRDGHLRYERQGEAAVYSGRVEGYQVKYVVSPGPTVEFWLDGALDGTYTITEDPTAIPEADKTSMFSNSEDLTGIEIQKDGGVWFRGAYLPYSYPSYYWLVDENGKSDTSGSTTIFVGTSTPPPDPAPTPQNILTMANGPELSRRGHTEFILLGLLASAVCLATLLFEDQLFRWNLSFQIQDPDRAEPSDWELFSRWAGWVVLTGVALLCFTLGSGLVPIS